MSAPTAPAPSEPAPARPVGRPAVRWAIGLTVLAAIFDTVCMGLRGRLFTSFGFIDHGWPVITLTGVVSAVMGGLIVTRDRRQPIGWLLLIPGLTTSLALALDAYCGWVLLDGGPGSSTAALISGWLASFLGAQIPFAANALILLLAPRGRLLGRGWWVAVAAAVVGCLCWSTPPLLEAATYAQVDPQPGPASTVLFVAGLVLVDAAVVAGVVSLFLRRRRSHGVERLQIQWFIVAAVPFALAILWLVTAQFVLDIPRGEATHLPLFLAELAFPLAITVAVLRYRLYDIGLVLNRAWLLLGATLVVGAGYVLVVGAVGGVVDGFWPVLLASAIAACLFQPLRAHVVRVADRLAYGVRLEPYEALADLSRRLADSPGSDATLAEIADACRRSTGARAVVIELHDEAGAPMAAGAAGDDPGPGGPTVTTPISDGRHRFGVIRIRPAPDRPLGRRDRQVVNGLSEHAALVFRNLRLEAGLRAKIDDLAVVADQLRESRRRMARVRDDELARLERTLRTTLVPELTGIGGRLDALAADPPPPGSPAWTELVDEVGRSLAALRDLSHGVHSDVLESIGLEAALAARLSDSGGPVRVIVTPALTRRPPAPAVAIAVEGAVVAAVEAGPLDGVELTVAGDLLVLVLEPGRPGPVPVALADVAGSGGGTVVAEGPRWVVRFPAEA
ncbi:hypothetical protein [Nakamurella sp.]|uniref:hypothetical protein n=1 Tax=Nakamurella sp. TaxID=1869182 RepID=UPI003B3B05AD